MNFVILFFIVAGAILMIVNIIRYFWFLKSIQDVISSGSKRDIIWKNMAFFLLVFFFLGYLFVGFVTKTNIMEAQILFWGSVFVAIVITLMMNLLETAKERGIEIAEVIISVIDARDTNLNGHSKHVQNLTMLFYKYLPYNYKKQLNPISLEYASLMHDIGKLGIPEAILDKPSKLNAEECKKMKEHPEIGVKILKPLHSFDEISDWIMYHH